MHYKIYNQTELCLFYWWFPLPRTRISIGSCGEGVKSGKCSVTCFVSPTSQQQQLLFFRIQYPKNQTRERPVYQLNFRYLIQTVMVLWFKLLWLARFFDIKQKSLTTSIMSNCGHLVFGVSWLLLLLFYFTTTFLWALFLKINRVNERFNIDYGWLFHYETLILRKL